MAKNEDHFDGFDAATKDKHQLLSFTLDIWLSIMANSKITVSEINICDFFAGEGQDKEGNKGSPAIICELLERHIEALNRKGVIVNVIFCEKSKKRFNKLKNKENLFHNLIQNKIKVIFYPKSFEEALDSEWSRLNENGVYNFIFIDPYGFVMPQELNKIAKLKRTDSLTFVPTRNIPRIKYTKISREYNFKWEEIYKSKSQVYPKIFVDSLKNTINSCRFPNYTKRNEEYIDDLYWIGHYRLKKPSTNYIYALIFGSSHPLGLEKFVEACWKANSNNGRSNEELIHVGIFGDTINEFKNELIMEIKLKNIENLGQVYVYTITNGFLPQHARDALEFMGYKATIFNYKNYQQKSERNKLIESLPNQPQLF